jgi:hypothetical protein
MLRFGRIVNVKGGRISALGLRSALADRPTGRRVGTT